MYGRTEMLMMTKIAKSDLSLSQLGWINSKMVFEKPAKGTGVNNSYFFGDFFDRIVRGVQIADCLFQAKLGNELVRRFVKIFFEEPDEMKFGETAHLRKVIQ